MIKKMIAKVVQRNNLTFEEARAVMWEIMDGRVTAAQLGSFLTALRMKGETVEEISGCARTMRDRAIPLVSKYSLLVDTCGTGGDNSCTFNISTTAAFVVAGAGLPVAKHGNRAVSSKCGSADALEVLGVKLDLSPGKMGEVLEQTGIAFLYAPVFHRAMMYAVGPRKEIGIRSIFNLLGPLTNPAGAKVQVLGVYAPELTEKLARVLAYLGSESACIVHGEGGLDEISTIGSTKVSFLQQGDIKTFTIIPEDFGIKRTRLEELRGGDSHYNARIIENILQGEKGPRRDVVVLNAAAAFWGSGLVPDLHEGINIAEKSLDSGSALKKLQQLITATNSVFPSDNRQNMRQLPGEKL